ncbi:angiopoietin-related protein 2-like [Tubulanus polymorphus]|uniref:angiopoietin-related protein 2-like n=1 Tax=Tubulanus polymorphus TaxID=672921 RepID=UPI003DA241B6
MESLSKSPCPNSKRRYSFDIRYDSDGWVIIEKRDVQNNLSFEREWKEYKQGFGDTKSWYLGNSKIYELTNECVMQLQLIIEFENGFGKGEMTIYETFKIEPEGTNYRINIGKRRIGSIAGWDDPEQTGVEFSTPNRGPQANRARLRKSAFWYSANNYYNDLHSPFPDAHWAKFALSPEQDQAYQNRGKIVHIELKIKPVVSN